jgi:transcriptional regulator with XRE-family HTH domain
MGQKKKGSPPARSQPPKRDPGPVEDARPASEQQAGGDSEPGIAFRIKAARLWRGIGVRDLERRTVAMGRHVSRGTISYLERQRQKRVELETLRRLAGALQVPAEWLALGAGRCPIPGAEMRVLTAAIQRGDEAVPEFQARASRPQPQAG